jgi:hypothetical protein
MLSITAQASFYKMTTLFSKVDCNLQTEQMDQQSCSRYRDGPIFLQTKTNA